MARGARGANVRQPYSWQDRDDVARGPASGGAGGTRDATIGLDPGDPAAVAAAEAAADSRSSRYCKSIGFDREGFLAAFGMFEGELPFARAFVRTQARPFVIFLSWVVTAGQVRRRKCVWAG